MTRFASICLAGVVGVCLMVAGAIAVPPGVKLTWPGKTEGAVVFDGTTHADKGLGCDTCHVSGEFYTRKDSTPMNMNAIKKDRYCGSCHNGKKAFDTKDSKTCKRCHKG